MEKRVNSQRLTAAALFAALICVATAVITIPLPGNGFANLGDRVVILCGALLGSYWGAAAAGAGAVLADCLLGYIVYAPATFFIKALMAVCVWLMLRHGRIGRFGWRLFAAVAAELVMTGGYFLFECCLYGVRVAAVDSIGNLLQGAVGAAVGVLLLSVIVHHQRLYKLFQ